VGGKSGNGVDGFVVPSEAARRHLAGLIADCRRRQHPIVFDIQILIGYLEDREPIATLLALLIESDDVPIAISVVTLAEVLVRLARNDDLSLVATPRRSISALPALTVVALDNEIAVQTAPVCGRIGMPMPDAARLVRTGPIAPAGNRHAGEPCSSSRKKRIPYRGAASAYWAETAATLSGGGWVGSVAMSEVSSKNRSIPAGVKVRIMRTGSGPWLWKWCFVPMGMFTKSPGPARIVSAPR
jgi:PIN domain nuclease of toxin-antitoxin system